MNDDQGVDSNAPTRQVILREASRLFAERGYHGTSTRDIARAVGIRQPSLFHHFSSKPEIMQTLQEFELGPALELLQQAQTIPGTAAARLYFAVYGEVWRLLDSVYDFTGTTSAAVLNDPAFAGAGVAYDKLLAHQTELIAEGIDSGELISIDPAIANRALEWTIEGVLVDATHNRDADPSRFADVLASFVVRSLLADTGTLDAVRAEAMALIEAHPTADNDSQNQNQ